MGCVEVVIVVKWARIMEKVALSHGQGTENLGVNKDGDGRSTGKKVVAGALKRLPRR